MRVPILGAFALAASLSLFLSPAAHAQVGIDGGTGTATVYAYIPPGQPVKEVDVWGAIRQPGRYRIPRDMELLDLLTLAGGPIIGTDEEGQSQEAVVRISRAQEDGERVQIYEAQLDEITYDSRNVPDLLEEDIVSVQVRVRARLYWRDVLSVTTSVAALTLLFLNIFDRGS